MAIINSSAAGSELFLAKLKRLLIMLRGALVFVAFVSVALAGSNDKACDDLVDKLLSSYLGPAIQQLGCSELGKAGLDKADHKLESVCYTSNGPISSVEVVANLHCHTGDDALIKSSISEHVTAEAQVRGADCSVQAIQVKPSGEIGKILIAAFEVNGHARSALQGGLNKMCGR